MNKINRSYYNLAFAKIMDICDLLQTQIPDKIVFLEQWMADGFFLRWEDSKGTFEICCIWDCTTGGPTNIRILGVKLFERILQEDLGIYQQIFKKSVEFSGDNTPEDDQKILDAWKEFQAFCSSQRDEKEEK